MWWWLWIACDAPPECPEGTSPHPSGVGCAWPDGALHGDFTLVHPDTGRVIERGVYARGQRHGVFTTYADDGSVAATVTWVDGRREGPERRYVGPLEVGRGTWVADQRHGRWSTWRADGSPESEVVWERGARTGDQAWFDRDGRPVPCPPGASPVEAGELSACQGPDGLEGPLRARSLGLVHAGGVLDGWATIGPLRAPFSDGQLAGPLEVDGLAWPVDGQPVVVGGVVDESARAPDGARDGVWRVVGVDGQLRWALVSDADGPAGALTVFGRGIGAAPRSHHGPPPPVAPAVVGPVPVRWAEGEVRGREIVELVAWDPSGSGATWVAGDAAVVCAPPRVARTIGEEAGCVDPNGRWDGPWRRVVDGTVRAQGWYVAGVAAGLWFERDAAGALTALGVRDGDDWVGASIAWDGPSRVESVRDGGSSFEVGYGPTGARVSVARDGVGARWEGDGVAELWAPGARWARAGDHVRAEVGEATVEVIGGRLAAIRAPGSGATWWPSGAPRSVTDPGGGAVFGPDGGELARWSADGATLPGCDRAVVVADQPDDARIVCVDGDGRLDGPYLAVDPRGVTQARMRAGWPEGRWTHQGHVVAAAAEMVDGLPSGVVRSSVDVAWCGPPAVATLETTWRDGWLEGPSTLAWGDVRWEVGWSGFSTHGPWSRAGASGVVTWGAAASPPWPDHGCADGVTGDVEAFVAWDRFTGRYGCARDGVADGAAARIDPCGAELERGTFAAGAPVDPWQVGGEPVRVGGAGWAGPLDVPCPAGAVWQPRGDGGACVDAFGVRHGPERAGGVVTSWRAGVRDGPVRGATPDGGAVVGAFAGGRPVGRWVVSGPDGAPRVRAWQSDGGPSVVVVGEERPYVPLIDAVVAARCCRDVCAADAASAEAGLAGALDCAAECAPGDAFALLASGWAPDGPAWWGLLAASDADGGFEVAPAGCPAWAEAPDL